MSGFILTLSGLLEAVIPILIIKSENYTDLVYTSVLGVVVTAALLIAWIIRSRQSVEIVGSTNSQIEP